jgi:transposase
MVNLKEWFMILELHQQGLSVSAIAERTGHDRKTVRKYIAQGLRLPSYTPRRAQTSLLDPFADFVRERIRAWPDLTGARLLREIRAQGYGGGRSILNDFIRTIRPAPETVFEHRFETAPGKQAQVDFAQFKVAFTNQPQTTRTVWLFSMVLGSSRYLWAEFVLHQDLPTLLRCHMAAFEHFGGVPREILYDRMKTAVLGEPDAEQPVVYNAKLLSCAAHYHFTPRACRPYRAKTKGKVERPFRYIRADFYLARTFEDLEDMNRQLRAWLSEVANARRHGTTGRIVREHFAEERPTLQVLPAVRFDAVLRVERRLSRDGCVSVGGNYYSVPDGTRARVVDVESTATQVRILEDGRVIAVHLLLQGRRQRSILPGHRRSRPVTSTEPSSTESRLSVVTGHQVPARSLSVYADVGAVLGARP